MLDQSSLSHIYALDTFDPVGSEYMRDVFPDIVEPSHPDHANWTENAIGLLVAKSKVTAELVARTKRLRYIVRHGVGYDNIDVAACKQKGIIVCNCPQVNVISVSEVALSLVTACAKNLKQLDIQLRAGEKLNKRFASLFSATILTGKTVGIVGGGTMGVETTKRLIGAFQMKVLLYDPYLPATSLWDEIPHTRIQDLDALLPQVDVLSVHVPLVAATKDLIDLSRLKSMKRSAILINTARGGVVNEEHLWQALRDGVIASAGVDTWCSEPPTRDFYGDVFDIPNLTMTPHIGGSPAEVQTAMCRSMCDHMLDLVNGKPARDRVA